ncbi:hypothetical protein P7K49_003616 [Saguinus oedipus]|uniref:Uncharacterized protein n=1 Tax=Saguinus oedipus TaxID=9490 RepID=A0ABQ9W5T6_SAGOE|nr:hypothetical protein P7K49_003616 [Saguinus oedipus]
MPTGAYHMIQETGTMVASLKELKKLISSSPSGPSFRSATPKTMANTTKPRMFMPSTTSPTGTFTREVVAYERKAADTRLEGRSRKESSTSFLGAFSALPLAPTEALMAEKAAPSCSASTSAKPTPSAEGSSVVSMKKRSAQAPRLAAPLIKLHTTSSKMNLQQVQQQQLAQEDKDAQALWAQPPRPPPSAAPAGWFKGSATLVPGTAAATCCSILALNGDQCPASVGGGLRSCEFLGVSTRRIGHHNGMHQGFLVPGSWLGMLGLLPSTRRS